MHREQTSSKNLLVRKTLPLIGWLLCSQLAATVDCPLPKLARSLSQEGYRDLSSAVRVTKVDSEKLAEAENVLQSVAPEKITKFSQLAREKLQSNPGSPFAADNLRHVENQHLNPLKADAKELVQLGINPEVMELLMLAHDLGKVEIPKGMEELLKHLYPEPNFVARVVLPHEYASMYWVEQLGRKAGLSPKEILATKRLIANHNFGIDLSKPENAGLAEDWWPKNFRESTVPAFRKAGIDPSENGQYRNAEGSLYSAALSAYDRAIASPFNRDGQETWQKFSQQDYLGWKRASAKDPSLPSPFNAPKLSKQMKMAAQGAQRHVDSLWKTISQLQKNPNFELNGFGPYQRQKQSLNRLLGLIEKFEKDNADGSQQGVRWVTEKGTEYLVQDGEKPTLLRRSGETWVEEKTGDNPISLLFEAMQSDR